MKEQMYDYFYHIEEKHWWFQGRLDIVMKLIHTYAQHTNHAKILDVGCGTGMVLQALQAYGTVWGIDKSEKAIRYSKEKVPGARVYIASFPEHMPNAQFDIITVLDVLEHIDQDRQALSKLTHMLKPGGIVVITAPAYKFLWTSHDDMNEHKRRYTVPELKEKVLEASLDIKKISYYNTLLFLPMVLVKLSCRFFFHDVKAHFGHTPSPAFINLPLRFLFSLEKYVLPYINFPFGISIIVIATKK